MERETGGGQQDDLPWIDEWREERLRSARRSEADGAPGMDESDPGSDPDANGGAVEREFVFEPSDAVIDPRLATRLPIDADPPEKRRAATRLGSLMTTVLKRILPPEAELLQLAADHWAEWVGSEIAAYTRPGRISGGTLYIYVKGSVRLAELKRHGMQSIDARVRRKAGKTIRAIRPIVDPGD